MSRSTDWTSLRVEYVNGVMSLRDLGRAHGISPGSLMAHSASEGWDAERKRLQAESSKAAQKRISKSRTDELATLNARNLELVKALNSQIAARLKLCTESKTAMESPEIKSLAHAMESVQRVGRIALGMSDGVAASADADSATKMREQAAEMERVTGVTGKMD